MSWLVLLMLRLTLTVWGNFESFWFGHPADACLKRFSGLSPGLITFPWAGLVADSTASSTRSRALSWRELVHLGHKTGGKFISSQAKLVIKAPSAGWSKYGKMCRTLHPLLFPLTDSHSDESYIYTQWKSDCSVKLQKMIQYRR